MEEYVPAYTFTIRAQYANQMGMLGRVTSVIGKHGGNIGAVDIVEMGGGRIVRDITVAVHHPEEAHDIVKRIGTLPGVRVVRVADLTFQLHLGGKIEVHSKVPVLTRSALSMVYTPGVARVSLAIAQDKEAAWNLTVKRNCVAVVTDGTAVLGIGDVGPWAALPVMEGKALLFKELGGVDAWPICLDTKDPDEIVKTVKYISPGFGGINLEDISAPRCFEIEERLREELDIPVFHDDQHGTAVVVAAALINALKVVKKDISQIKVVVSGAGAAGIACSQMLLQMGVPQLVMCDRSGAIYKGRGENMNPYKEAIAEKGNREGLRGSLSDVIEGADMFLGVSAPKVLQAEDVKRMARDPIVFALANPDPEIVPEDAAPLVRVLATGRSDYPNQINNALCFPGLFRGVLDSRAKQVNHEMMEAAAGAIASLVPKNALHEEHIVPSLFDKAVAPAVAREVARAAHRTGVARRQRRRLSYY